MEIEIESKRNNPLLKRTEVYFTVKHEGEGTPNREIIRSELADKLNAKKENIIVNKLDCGFGSAVTTGYAKVYSSAKETKNEREYILKRNKLGGGKKPEKKEEKTEDKPADVKDEEPVKEEQKSEPEAEKEETPPEEPKAEEKTEEASKEEETKSEEPKAEGKKE